MTQALVPGGDVHLWTADVSELEDEEHYAECFDVLSSSEQKQVERFRFKRDQNSFVASHFLRRWVLSHYESVEPNQWRFVANEHGRPRIAFPLLDDPPQFNCSKSADLVVCAVIRGVAVGVDIERLDRRVPNSVAEATFASGEKAALEALPPLERGQRFFALWTLKEAYLKARGVGLTQPLDSMEFAVTESPAGSKGVAAKMVFSEANDCDEWQFTVVSPTPSHIASVCVRRSHGLARSLEIRRFSKVLISG